MSAGAGSIARIAVGELFITSGVVEFDVVCKGFMYDTECCLQQKQYLQQYLLLQSLKQQQHETLFSGLASGSSGMIICIRCHACNYLQVAHSNLSQPIYPNGTTLTIYMITQPICCELYLCVDNNQPLFLLSLLFLSHYQQS